MKKELINLGFLNYNDNLFLIPCKFKNEIPQDTLLYDIHNNKVYYNQSNYDSYNNEYLPLGIKVSSSETVLSFKEPFDSNLKDIFDTPPPMALEYWEKKTDLKITWSWEEWQYIALEMHSRMFTVAKVVQADILQIIYDGVQKGIDEGMTKKQVGIYLEQKLADNGWSGEKTVTDPKTGKTSKLKLDRSRLEFIYQENMTRALTSGRYQRQKSLASVLNIWEYEVIEDSRTTTICNSLKNIVAEASNPIWNAIYPPNHFGCRAYVNTYTEKQAKKNNIKLSSNKDIKDMEKPAKGFDVEPDEIWNPDTSKYTKGLKKRLEKSLKKNKSNGSLDIPI